MEHTRREYGVRTRLDRGREMVRRPRPPAGDQRYVDNRADRLDQLEVEPLLGPVGVHRVEQDLARAELAAALRPLDRVQPRGPASAVGGDLEPARLLCGP